MSSEVGSAPLIFMMQEMLLRNAGKTFHNGSITQNVSFRRIRLSRTVCFCLISLMTMRWAIPIWAVISQGGQRGDIESVMRLDGAVWATATGARSSRESPAIPHYARHHAIDSLITWIYLFTGSKEHCCSDYAFHHRTGEHCSQRWAWYAFHYRHDFITFWLFSFYYVLKENRWRMLVRSPCRHGASWLSILSFSFRAKICSWNNVNGWW